MRPSSDLVESNVFQRSRSALLVADARSGWNGLRRVGIRTSSPSDAESRECSVFDVADTAHDELGPVPVRVAVNGGSLVGSSGWRARRAGLLGMPGGYDGYLVSLRRVVDYVVTAQPSPEQLQAWMRDALAITAGSAYTRWRTLCRAGLFYTVSGMCSPAPACKAWLRYDDPTWLIAEIHRNIQFVGELLTQLDAPVSTEELLHAANERYRMGWLSVAQLNFRRGWLQSSRMLEHNNVTGTLKRTDAGTALLARLEVESPLT